MILTWANKRNNIAGIISSSRKAPFWHHSRAIVGLIRSQHVKLPPPQGFRPWKIELLRDTYEHDFEIILRCCSISDLTITLRYDIGNRRLDHVPLPR